MNLARRAAAWGALVLIAALAVTGCASVGQHTPAAGITLTGRLSVQVESTDQTPARNETASFELKGSPEAGRLNLSTPLGQVVAQARWAGAQAWLSTSQGDTPYESLDALTEEVLGSPLPVAALFDWLRGQPWPAAPSVRHPQGFEQLGWQVDLARFGDGWIAAQRAQRPVVRVRAKMDAP